MADPAKNEDYYVTPPKSVEQKKYYSEDYVAQLLAQNAQQAREIERLKEALRFIEKGGLMGCNAEYREIAANALKLEEGK